MRSITYRLPRTVLLLFLAGWLALIQFEQFPTLVNHGFDNRDSAAFALAGKLINQGAVPYQDFWDQKPPLVYWLNGIALRCSNDSTAGIWGLSLLFLFLSAFLIYHATRRMMDTPSARWSVFAFAAALPGIYAGGNMTESYAIPLQLGTVLFLFDWMKNQRSKTFLFGAGIGVMAGLLFMLRQNLIGSSIAVAFFVLFAIVRHREIAKIFQFIAGGFAGTAAIFGGIVIFLARHNALERFWEYAFRYNFSYKTNADFFAKFVTHLTVFDYVPLVAFALLIAIIICWRSIIR